MFTSIITCSQCGAALSGKVTRCRYCGAAVQSNDAEGFSDKETPRMPAHFSRLKRPKVRRPMEASGCTLFFVPFWILGVVLVSQFIMKNYLRELEKYNLLLKEGRPTTAVITHLKIDYGVDTNPALPDYYVYYEFVAEVQGRATPFQDRDTVSEQYYKTLSVGQPIPIVYWAADPRVSAVQVEFAPPNLFIPIFVKGLRAILILVGMSLFLVSIRNLYFLSRLRSQGHLGQAFIFDRWTGEDSNGTPTYFVAYAFEVMLPNGRKIIVTRALQNRDIYEHYHVGATVPVRYLPDHPQICRLEIGGEILTLDKS